ncbi:hypothetical protein V6N13_009112 [Hibiscus sabdariffa]
MLDRTGLDQWFDRMVPWSPKIVFGSRSVWLSIVSLSIHLWLRRRLRTLLSCGGHLCMLMNIKLSSNFERAHILIKTMKGDRIDDIMEILTLGYSAQIPVQEVVIVHSHDIVCRCGDDDYDSSNVDGSDEQCTAHSVRLNPLFTDVEKELTAHEFNDLLVGVGMWSLC